MAEIVLGEAVLKYRWGTYNFMCYEKVFFFFFFSSIPEDKNLNIFLVLAENIFKKIIWLMQLKFWSINNFFQNQWKII